MYTHQRTPKADFDGIPGELPEATVPDDVDLRSVAQNAIVMLNDLQEHDLAPIAIWRDLLALTDTYRTFYSPTTVFTVLKELSAQKDRSVFRLKKDRDPRIGKSANDRSWVDVDLLFAARHGGLTRRCMGTVSSVYDTESKCWRIWMLRTWLECFDGHGHPDEIEPVQNGNVAHSADTAKTQPSGVLEEGEAARREYEAVVVGAGQAGLGVGGRLHALGISYVVLEEHHEVGDVWRKRYESVRWHTARDYGSLPFGHTFPSTDDKLLSGQRIGAGHQNWVQKYGINVLTKTSVESARWDDVAKSWTITASTAEGQVTLLTRNLVLAIGTGHGTPKYPSWATADRVKSSGFRGTILHSFADYRSSHQWAGQRGVVIGSANTAHDVAEDMANANMETTMIQRNPTFIFPGEWLLNVQDAHYHVGQHPAVADRETFTYPYKILRQVINEAVYKGIEADSARFDALERVGFKVDRYGDLYNNLLVRFGGHYVDIGCSARIAAGEIKVKTEPVQGLTEDGLLFEDGKQIRADLIVLCTGFDHDFRNDAAEILGRDVAEKIDDFWGLSEEGEIRGHARPAGHPNLYYFGGDTRMARFFSRFVSLQIQADVLGRPMQPYLGP